MVLEFQHELVDPPAFIPRCIPRVDLAYCEGVHRWGHHVAAGVGAGRADRAWLGRQRGVLWAAEGAITLGSGVES